MARKPDSNNPSSVFFWKDYENDEGLRVSSLAAQGLWMRLLCVAAKSDPYGYVLINGCEIGVTGVARLGSVTETEAATLLTELERNGVFSRDRKGRIFSRRMVKESATRKKAVENGKKGGNPALSASAGKTKEKSNPVNPLDNGVDKPPYPYPNPVEEGGGGSACVREAENPPKTSTFRERILAAIGVDPVSGLTGHGGRMLGTQADMAVAARWQDLGLTEPEIVAVIAETMAGKRDGPPSTFGFFDKPMARLKAAKDAPPPEAIPFQPKGSRHDNRAFDATINALADGLSAGTIQLDTASRDPFSLRRR